jgi:hypothetical protein
VPPATPPAAGAVPFFLVFYGRFGNKYELDYFDDVKIVGG